MAKRVKEDEWEPSVGNGDTDVGVVVYEDSEGDRHAIVVPRSVKALKGEALAVVTEIQAESRAVMKARERLDQLVPEARALGVSWNVIAWSTGMATQSAHERWR